ncbi:MAG: Holliday junction resolvase RuvX [Patescibacteria group bacterium]
MELIGIDYGDKRVGVARASSLARIPEPITILDNDDNLFSSLQKLVDELMPVSIIVGVPRNLSGELTPQSHKILNWIEQLKQSLRTDAEYISWDETLSSVEARSRASTASDKHIDDIAACVILDDYLKGTNV